MFKAKFLVISFYTLWGVINANTVTINVNELCNLAPNTTILQPNSCTNWLKCPSTPGAKDMEEGSCVFGLYFNKDTGKCDYRENVNCPFEKNSQKQNLCENELDDSFVADSEKCEAYIYCKGGVEYRSYCPSNLVFDPISQACVYRSQYKCPEFKPPTATDPLCMTLPNGTFVTDKNDCTRYGQCIDGAFISKSCEQNFAWDHIKHNCVDIDEVICYPTAKQPEPELKICINHVGPISDGESCSGYYFCKKMFNDTHDRKPEHFTCASGMFFDSNTLSCRDRMNVKCLYDRCEGMGNKYVNIPGDCKAYALCQNGVAKTKGICPSNYYFDERTQGCTPQVVSYAACSA